MGQKFPIRWLKHKIRSLDIYGKSITFTYKGQEKYNTLFGGLISIIIKIFIYILGLYLFIMMINRKQTASSFNRIVDDLRTDTNQLDLTSNTFAFFTSINYIHNNRLVSFDN